MIMKQLTDFVKKQPIALGCAFFAVVLAGGTYFRRGALAEAQAARTDKTEQRDHIVSNVTDSVHLNEQFAAMTQAVQSIESRFVHADQIAINLQYFYKLESETQTKLTQLQQTGVIAPRDGRKHIYAGIGYSISVQGTYPQLMDFLRRIENSEHFSHVRGLTLAHANGGDAAASSKDLLLGLEIELLGLP